MAAGIGRCNSAQVKFNVAVNVWTTSGGTNDPRFRGYCYANVDNRHFEINLPETGDYIVDVMGGRYAGTGSARIAIYDGTQGQSLVYPRTARQATVADEFVDAQMDANRYTDVQWLARDVSTRGVTVPVTSRAGTDQGIRVQIGDTVITAFPYIRLYQV